MGALIISATDCLDIPPIPEGAFILRVGASLKVLCEHTTEKWHLNCIDDSWVGDIGECSLTQGMGH